MFDSSYSDDLTESERFPHRVAIPLMKSDPHIRLNLERITRVSPSLLPLSIAVLLNTHSNHPPKEILLHSLRNNFLPLNLLNSSFHASLLHFHHLWQI